MQLSKDQISVSVELPSEEEKEGKLAAEARGNEGLINQVDESYEILL